MSEREKVRGGKEKTSNKECANENGAKDNNNNNNELPSIVTDG